MTFPEVAATSRRLIAMDPPSPEQAAAIARFLREQTPGYYHPERAGMVRWKLCDNETHPGFASAIVVGPEERVVSLCTVTPKRLWREGRERRWAEIGDTFTDEKFRRKGMFVECADASRSRAQAAGYALIYGLPNDQALPGWVRKLGFAVKRDLALDGYSLLLGTRALAVRTRLAGVAVARRALSASWVASGSRRASALLFSLITFGRGEIRLSPESVFGEEYDALWRAARREIPNAQVRDARYLRWRYAGSPFSFVVLAARLRGELVGYIATLTVGQGAEGAFLHTLLLDWLYCPSRGKDVGFALLAGAVDHAISSGADVVSAVASRASALALPFARCGFLRRPVDMPVMFHQNDEGRTVLADPSPWHFTLSDTDSF